MNNIKDLMTKIENEGYSELNAMSRVSQDILLKAIKNAGIDNRDTLNKYLKILIFENTKYTDIEKIHERLEGTFNDKRFVESINKSDKNWTHKHVDEVFENILRVL